jgi:hypothetical protein
MKTKTLGSIVALGLAGMFGFGACSQPRAECQVALATTGYAYIAKYKVKTPPAAGCEGIVRSGDRLGMEFYHPPTEDGTTYDPSKTSFVIQPRALGLEALIREDAAAYVADSGLGCDGDPSSCLDNDPSHHAYGVLDFASSEPDEGNFCDGSAVATQAATMSFPEIPEVPDPEGGEPFQEAMPATTIKYEWKNPKFYVTAAAPGTQFSADLTYTEDDCTVEYEVIGMWPAIYCGGYDEDGYPTYADPDDTACDPCPPPGAPYGSGISPDFQTKCDPELFFCVLKDAKDKTKDATSIPQLLDSPIECADQN